MKLKSILLATILLASTAFAAPANAHSQCKKKIATGIWTYGPCPPHRHNNRRDPASKKYSIVLNSVVSRHFYEYAIWNGSTEHNLIFYVGNQKFLVKPQSYVKLLANGPRVGIQFDEVAKDGKWTPVNATITPRRRVISTARGRGKELHWYYFTGYKVK